MNLPPEISYLEGFLSAFEWVNGKADHDFTFSIMAYPSGLDDLTELTDRHFSPSNPTGITLEPVPDWQSALKAAVQKWLLAYITGPSPHRFSGKQATRFSLSNESFQSEFVEAFVQQLLMVGAVERAWEVSFATTEHYECASLDLVLQQGKWVVFLHFGVSD